MSVKNRSACHFLFIVLIVFFISCREREEVREIIRPVRFIEAESTRGIYTRTFSGVAQYGTESTLSFKVMGAILRIPVRVGDRVKSGRFLADLESSDYELKVKQAEAQLLQGKAQARNADSTYERVRTLYERRSASKSDLDSARMASEAGGAQVQTLQKQLELARLQLSYTRLSAPVDGAIAAVYVEVGENVAPGQPILLLTSGSQQEVEISMPEALISGINRNTQGSVRFDALPGKTFQATVSEVGIRSMSMATTFPVTLRLNQPDPEIRAGMAALVTFMFDSGDDRLRFLIPSQAVGEDRDGRFVFCIDPSSSQDGTGTVRRTSVVVGELTEEGLEIYEGLADGDLVVTAGISRIVDGQVVKM